MLNLQVARHVRYQSQDHGGVVILDTAEGEWLALNATAGHFWRVWGAGTGFEEGLRMVADRYPHVPPEALRADAERLVRELIDRGLLTAGATPAKRTAPLPVVVPMTVGGEAVMAEAPGSAGRPRPGWGRGSLALCVLIATCLLVRCSSFRVQLVLVRTVRRRGRRPAAVGQAAATVAAVDWAVRCYPGRAACLEQSLAAVLLAAAAGRRLDWCLGALADPYRFHAWVEAEGRPVPALGDPRSSLGYVRLLSA
jgi:Transglutaminase-like superfamily/Coenzyme PQQ synthesis protein D (PqqD)